MASHGVPRQRSVEERSQEARQQEIRKIEKYQELDRSVHDKIDQHQYTPETLQNISELLSSNPEYYSVWNYRRQVLRHEFSQAVSSDSEDAGIGRVAGLIKSDLLFLMPLLRSFPKCYWIWNYRLWLLDEAKRLLPLPLARRLWQEELALVGKMLSLDSRNFHGWGYRRFVVETLETLPSEGTTRKTMAPEEFEYAKKMIGTNLSNFSAWHYRTKLIQRLLDENSANDEERKRMLNDELDLIHRALCDPYDQSLWFYHQNIMCTFDPSLAGSTMAPNLNTSERLEYVQREIDEIQELSDGAEDCKYIYQGLIDCTLLMCKIQGTLPSGEQKKTILSWLSELKKLDPLRQGRWLDFERSLEEETSKDT